MSSADLRARVCLQEQAAVWNALEEHQSKRQWARERVCWN